MPAGVLELTAKQTAWLEAVLSGRYKYLLAGGAIRGAKTVGGLAILWVLCRMFPRSRWAIIRKDLPTLKRNTIPTFEKFKPSPFVGTINRQDWLVRCANGSEILFFTESISEDPELNRFRGLEVNGFLADEANELQQVTFHKMIERAGSWIIQPTESDPKPNQPPPLILATCNPADNWVRTTFYEPHQRGELAEPYFFLPMTSDDNPYVTEDQREGWKNLPDLLYRKFVLGDWSVSDDPARLIQLEWVLNAANVEAKPGLNRLGVDVARYGDDESCWAILTGNLLRSIEAKGGMAVNVVADETERLIGVHTVNADQVRVDVVGLGAGVVDILKSRHYRVHEFGSGDKAVDERPPSAYRFKNRRSQAWWALREMLRRGELAIPDCPPKLMQDLTAPRYTMTGDRVITVESKDDIRKRIGRSTDYGDALMMAVAPLPAPPVFQTVEVQYAT